MHRYSYSIALGLCIYAYGQIGKIGSPVPPDIVKQMRKQVAAQTATGFTLAEIQEFKKLHDADSAIWKQIIAGNTRLEGLEHLFQLSDQGVNTRMVVQHEDRITHIEAWQKTSDDNRKTWEDRMWSATQAIVVIIVGMAITGIGSILIRLWNRFKYDPRRDPDRRSALEIDERADARTAEVLGQLKTVKQEVADTKVAALVTQELAHAGVAKVLAGAPGKKDWLEP